MKKYQEIIAQPIKSKRGNIDLTFPESSTSETESKDESDVNEINQKKVFNKFYVRKKY